MNTEGPADPPAADRLTRLLSDAFLLGPLADWLVPDLADRRAIYPRYWAVIARRALVGAATIDTVGGTTDQPPADQPAADRSRAAQPGSAGSAIDQPDAGRSGPAQSGAGGSGPEPHGVGGSDLEPHGAGGSGPEQSGVGGSGPDAAAVGAALWYDTVGGEPETDTEQDGPAFATACGRYLDRFIALDEAMHGAYPNLASYAYLGFVAVAPDHQRRGVGAGLLARRHRRLDESGTAAFLIASSAGSARLYRRLGYRPHGADIRPSTDAPALYPMLRPPAPPADHVEHGAVDRSKR